jgi:hypothetical protein
MENYRALLEPVRDDSQSLWFSIPCSVTSTTPPPLSGLGSKPVHWAISAAPHSGRCLQFATDLGCNKAR